MRKKLATKSAFLNPRVLIGLAFCSIGLLLALLAFALYPGGHALAQGPEQDLTALEIPGTPETGTKEILTPQEFGREIEPSNTFTPPTPLQSSACVVTVLPNNGGVSGNERAPHTGFR